MGRAHIQDISPTQYFFASKIFPVIFLSTRNFGSVASNLHFIDISLEDWPTGQQEEEEEEEGGDRVCGGRILDLHTVILSHHSAIKKDMSTE